MSKTSTQRSIQPYLYFQGRCAEAVQFYRDALGATVTALVHFKECPDASMCPPGADDKVMHVSFQIGATTVHASDGQCQGPAKFEGFSLSLSAADKAEADLLFAALADRGEVVMPLTATPFSPHFGMVTDRFGVSWFVLVPPTDQK